MGFNSSEFEQIGQGIFIYRNFLSIAETERLYAIALSRTNWFSPSSSGASVTTKHEGDLDFIYNRMKNYFTEEATLDQYCYFQKYEIGQDMGAHQDDNKVLDEIKKSNDYVEGMEYVEVLQPLFGTVIYLNTPEMGGELVYTVQGITYKPSPGDLVVHEADTKCTHMSLEVLAGNKIVIPGYAYKKIKVPV
jgi:hypothetical protein